MSIASREKIARTAEEAGHRLILPLARFGDYELLEEVARGGMGVIYRARQVSLNRTVAVKMIRAGALASKEFVHRFRTEAAAAAVLQHPNIVAVHEVGVHEGEHFFSMDFVAGRDLEQIAREGPLPAKRAALYGRKIADAVHYAHQQGILHRDLKPSNVLIDASDQPRITDFGLAKQLGADSGVTLSGQVLGTPGFLPPEQASATRGAIRAWSDVYSLGAILYCLLTGRAPFVAGSLEETLNQVLNQEPVSPRLLNAAVPRDLETICLKCLEKEPSRRYPTAQELADELERFLKDEPILARPVGTAGRAWRWCRRKPVVAGLAVALLLAVLVGAVATLWQLRRAERTANALRERVYASDMNLAARALGDKNLGRVVQLLGRYIPKAGETDLRGFEWRYLWQACQGDEVDSIEAHEAEIRCLAVMPDGESFVTGSFDRTLKLWDLRTRKFKTLLKTFPERTHLLSAKFSADGALLAAGDPAHLFIWETAGWREVKALGTAGVPLAFLPRSATLACASGDPTSPELRLWDTQTWQAQTRANNFQDFAVSPDERWFAIAKGEYTGKHQGIELWDSSWRFVGLLEQATHVLTKIYDMAFSPDGRRLAAGDLEGRVGVWDTETRQLIAQFQAQAEFASTLRFSPDGGLLAVASGTEQTIVLWDTRRWRKCAELAGHHNGVWDLAFSDDGKELISASRDHTVKFWRPQARAQPQAIPSASKIIGFLADGQTAVLLSPDRLILWDVNLGRERQSCVLSPGKLATSGAVATEAGRAAIGYCDGTIELRELTTGVVQRSFVVSTNPVSRVRLSPAGKEVAAIAHFLPGQMSLSGRLALWNVANGESLSRAIAATGGAATAVAFSHAGKLVAIACADNSIRVWDLSVNGERPACRGHTWDVTGVAFSPDDRTLASGSWDGTVRLWDLSTGRQKGTLPGSGELCFSPEGRTLAAAPMSSVVRLYHMASQQEIMTLTWNGAHSGEVFFSPDGSVLGVGSSDMELARATELDRVTFWRARSLTPVDSGR